MDVFLYLKKIAEVSPSLVSLHTLPAVLISAIGSVFGALIGSFLNVCIYRLPRGESVAWPASHCPSCATPIQYRDNIPLVSFLLLRGRCRSCHAPIPMQYPLVEAFNAVGYAVLFRHFGLSWSAVIYALLFSALLVVTGTDLSHKIIPNVITIPGIVFGLICASTILPVGFVNSLSGIVVGGGILWFLAWVSPYLFGKEGMGGGDIKLIAMIGAFLGWKPVLLTIMIGSLAGSVVGVSLIAMNVMRRDQYLPFGPFLVFGAIISLFFHQPVLDWYLSLIDLPR